MKGLGADGPYWEALSENRLALPQCAQCQSWQWPAPFRCASCGHRELTWVERPLKGQIYTWTRTWQAFDGMENFPMPLCTVLVEIADAGGIRLLGIMDEGAPAPHIGMAVKGHIVSQHIWGRDIPALRWNAA